MEIRGEMHGRKDKRREGGKGREGEGREVGRLSSTPYFLIILQYRNLRERIFQRNVNQ